MSDRQLRQRMPCAIISPIPIEPLTPTLTPMPPLSPAASSQRVVHCTQCRSPPVGTSWCRNRAPSAPPQEALPRLPRYVCIQTDQSLLVPQVTRPDLRGGSGHLWAPATRSRTALGSPTGRAIRLAQGSQVVFRGSACEGCRLVRARVLFHVVHQDTVYIAVLDGCLHGQASLPTGFADVGQDVNLALLVPLQNI